MGESYYKQDTHTHIHTTHACTHARTHARTHTDRGNETQKSVGWEEMAWIYFPKIIHLRLACHHGNRQATQISCYHGNTQECCSYIFLTYTHSLGEIFLTKSNVESLQERKVIICERKQGRLTLFGSIGPLSVFIT